MANGDNSCLFGDLDDFTLWKQEWKGMPEFIQNDVEPWRTIELCFEDYFDKKGHLIKNKIIKVHFDYMEYENIKLLGQLLKIVGFNSETKFSKVGCNIKEFSSIVGQTITDDTKFVWFPKQDYLKPKNFIYEGIGCNPQYPLYVISKGRWESRLTVKALENKNIPYRIVVEPQEYDNYAKFIDPKKIFTLPFSNLGQGSIPARNWVWEHSISLGAKKHWILDDNIQNFYRMTNNKRLHISDGTIFKCAEDFVDRYENVPLAGFNYMGLANARAKMPPYRLNTRIYSMILIQNDIPYRWRGRYNEDTDLSLRILQDGFCTILFNAFLGDKVATMVMKGGNTDELYQKNIDKENDGRYKMAKSLQEQHPNIVSISWKWDRWQHEVDYSIFKRNKLKLKQDVNIVDEINNYGMVLKKIT